MINKIFKHLIAYLLLLLPIIPITSKEKAFINEHFLNNPSNELKKFSNLGYWEHIDLTNKMNDKTRLESQKNLYRYVLDHLELYNDDKTLEIGIGDAHAAKIINDEYASGTYTGIDVLKTQVDMAEKLNQDLLKSKKTYKYIVSKTGKIPFEKQAFSKLFSVETTQYFYPFERFAHEAERILKQNGKIVIAGVFVKNKQNISKLPEYVKAADKNINMTSIDEAYSSLKNKGFVDVHVEPIGQYVFEGFDKWANQTNSQNSAWKKAYDAGLVDYYVISGYKPVELIRI